MPDTTCVRQTKRNTPNHGTQAMQTYQITYDMFGVTLKCTVTKDQLDFSKNNRITYGPYNVLSTKLLVDGRVW